MTEKTRLIYNLKRYTVLFCVLCVSLAVRIWLIDKRWINPDEGAHLMDGLLVLQGKMPFVDFDSRQPLYVFVNAMVFKAFGSSYIIGRLVPLACSILTGIFVFLMGRILYGRTAAAMATAIYWLLPFETLNSVVVKTEPMVTLLMCISFYFGLSGVRNNEKRGLVVSGIFACLAYYVRQSALISLGVMFAVVIAYDWKQPKKAAVHMGLFLCGYIGVVVTIILIYGRHLGVGEVLGGSLNPLNFIFVSLKKSVGLLGFGNMEAVKNIGTEAVRRVARDRRWDYNYLVWIFKMHSFLLAGVLFAVIQFCKDLFARKEAVDQRQLGAWIFVFSWLGTLGFAYTYYFFSRGFFIDYFREFYPPLTLAFSGWIYLAARQHFADKLIERYFNLVLIAAVILYAAQFKFGFFPVFFQLTFVAFLVIWIYFIGMNLVKDHKILHSAVIFIALGLMNVFYYFPDRKYILVFILLVFSTAYLFLIVRQSIMKDIKSYVFVATQVVIISSLVVNISYSSSLLDIRYDAIWSPEAVESVASFLETSTDKNDKVLSGAVIWELQAQRAPFNMISHPLVLALPLSDKRKKEVGEAIRNTPPDIIIKDGYTEKTYGRAVPWLEEFIAEKYSLLKTQDQAKYPVLVYRKN